MKRQNQNNSIRNKKIYKGPFQHNKNIDFDNVKRTMKTVTDGPTAETCSYNDSTLSQSRNEKRIPIRRRPKTKRNKIKTWVYNNMMECIIGIIITGFFSYISMIIFTHSNHFVSIDKDLEYIKHDNEEQQNLIENINSKTTENSTNIKLIQQKIEITKE